MQRIHLLRVDGAESGLAGLLAAARAAGVRIGWLDLGTALTLPPAMAGGLSAGLDRAVAVGEGWSLVARRRPGPPRLRDLLRQQFLGCALVLVRGGSPAEVPAVLSALSDGRWRVSSEGGAERFFATDDLLAALRRPRPWPGAAGAADLAMDPTVAGGGEEPAPPAE